MTILLTGLTGELGSALAPILQLKERIFCLVRDGKARADKGSLQGIPVEQIIDGDITERFCGLSTARVNFLREQEITRIIHAAASVKFDKELAEEIWLTNFIGTKNVISVASALGVKEFHYISTAYASAGRNPYEESKLAAEGLVKKSKMPYSIYRLSVIIGDSRTGHTKTFNGFYGFFAGLHRIAERSRKKRGFDGEVQLPVYINCSFKSTLNLIPVDWTVKTLVALIYSRCQNKTFHITHPNPPRVQWIMEEGFRAIGIKGIKYNDYRHSQPEQTNHLLKVIQKAVNRNLGRYHPYITKEEKFPFEITQKFLDGKYESPSEITPELLTVLLNFAVKKKFGKIKENIARE